MHSPNIPRFPKHQMIDNHTGIHNIHIRKAQAKPTKHGQYYHETNIMPVLLNES